MTIIVGLAITNVRDVNVVMLTGGVTSSGVVKVIVLMAVSEIEVIMVVKKSSYVVEGDNVVEMILDNYKNVFVAS